VTATSVIERGAPRFALELTTAEAETDARLSSQVGAVAGFSRLERAIVTGIDNAAGQGVVLEAVRAALQGSRATGGRLAGRSLKVFSVADLEG
jgi:hypothetical protein